MWLRMIFQIGMKETGNRSISKVQMLALNLHEVRVKVSLFNDNASQACVFVNSPKPR